MTNEELAQKYNLSKSDMWELPQRKGTWIISHDACEKIASIEKIELTDIKVLNSELGFARFIVSMKKGEKTIMSIGEADSRNCKNLYFGCMAEKRGIDRCILKLIDAYQYGVYSETESDDFENKTEPKNEGINIANNNAKNINAVFNSDTPLSKFQCLLAECESKGIAIPENYKIISILQDDIKQNKAPDAKLNSGITILQQLLKPANNNSDDNIPF